MSRIPQEPHYEAGVTYPSRDVSDLAELLNVLREAYPSTTLSLGAAQGADEIQKLDTLLTALGEQRAELERMRREHERVMQHVAEYAGRYRTFTLRETAQALGVGRSSVSRWRSFPLALPTKDEAAL